MGSSPFRERVYAIVRSIPRGRIMTYGQVALLCGMPRAAQAVGWTLHTAPDDVPCQRVVNRFGGLADAFTWGGVAGHRALLEAEGVIVRSDLTIDIDVYQWWPDPRTVAALQLPPDILDRLAALIERIPADTQLSPHRRRR